MRSNQSLGSSEGVSVSQGPRKAYGRMLQVDDGTRQTDLGYEVHSDVDSEGNEPPSLGEYVPPATVDNTFVPPPRTNAEIRLPFTAVNERVRYRGQFASKVFYEEWADAEGGADGGAVLGSIEVGSPSGSKHAVRRLEPDSDYPVGRGYFWHAVCPPCNETFYPHVPSGWGCPICKRKVWQLPEDPESKACAVCRRKVAKMRILNGHRIHSPISLNGHNCKRCGRVVCDDCYHPRPTELQWLGFSAPQKVCTQCIKDIEGEFRLPEEEDLGVLNEEFGVKAMDEEQIVKPFWPPHCGACNIYMGEPPLRWECRTCGEKVWQPTASPHSEQCWVCKAKLPKVRCHKCGQLVCDKCGSFAQPLPELGFDSGEGLSVCRPCYGGISFARGFMPDDTLDALMKERDEHRRGGPEPMKGGVSSCTLCTSLCGEGTRRNCALCGWICCLACTPYQQPCPPKPGPQPICTLCFHPRKALLPDHRDMPYWPPRCGVCQRTYQKPPERWRCPYNCGNVWQPLTHVASKACASCGKATAGGGVNCRCCGRIVCSACGSNMAEVPEHGFTRGMKFPRCPKCRSVGVPAGSDASRGSIHPRPESGSPPRGQSAPRPTDKVPAGRSSPPGNRGGGGPSSAANGRGGGSPGSGRGGGGSARGGPARGGRGGQSPPRGRGGGSPQRGR